MKIPSHCAAKATVDPTISAATELTEEEQEGQVK